MTDVRDFWTGLSVVLKEIDRLADEPAAETLIDYLERYREEWDAVMRLLERAQRIAKAG
jgi:hypothetical protein